eukprot:gnl/TRDRNA2_/TRDRNA2_28791_c0_seq2.p1 gnl/TRDRNA2_/TRDRNA2_28791_c0~~gnl/TRDRNA2_/TRDRNA2_28791_c0_seq2.p1  ORF type:complete len:290 (+),score=40.49 gnl/TRDRNA2_/TRDRNA2_28791_c0_seq2:117-986(+)
MQPPPQLRDITSPPALRRSRSVPVTSGARGGEWLTARGVGAVAQKSSGLAGSGASHLQVVGVQQPGALERVNSVASEARPSRGERPATASMCRSKEGRLAGAPVIGWTITSKRPQSGSCRRGYGEARPTTPQDSKASLRRRPTTAARDHPRTPEAAMRGREARRGTNCGELPSPPAFPSGLRAEDVGVLPAPKPAVCDFGVQTLRSSHIPREACTQTDQTAVGLEHADEGLAERRGRTVATVRIQTDSATTCTKSCQTQSGGAGWRVASDDSEECKMLRNQANSSPRAK